MKVCSSHTPLFIVYRSCPLLSKNYGTRIWQWDGPSLLTYDVINSVPLSEEGKSPFNETLDGGMRVFGPKGVTFWPQRSKLHYTNWWLRITKSMVFSQTKRRQVLSSNLLLRTVHVEKVSPQSSHVRFLVSEPRFYET